MGGKWHIEMHTEFWWGNPKETDHAAKLGRDVRRILKWILQKQRVGLGWIQVAWDRDTGIQLSAWLSVFIFHTAGFPDEL